MNTTACSGCDGKPALVGWVYESPGRGTLTLVVTCLFTIFLCTWVVIHPRVYKSRLLGAMYKITLFIKAILAPEFIAVEGLQEWTQCRKMKKECVEIMGDDFKLIHAFYVSMLALRYRTDCGDRVIWPNQYTWLLQQRLIDWRDHASWGLDEWVIRDKSNADSAVKLVAFCQVLWFVAQSIMRTAHGFPLSQLESMTLSYIPLFAATYFFWWIKPKDIKTPSVVDLPSMLPEQRITFESMVVSNKFDNEGLEEQVSFWNEGEDRAAMATSATKITRIKKGEYVARQEEKPKQNIEHTMDIEEVKETLWPAICLFGASFGALHLISWNTIFPTVVELWLWRVAALASIFSMLIFMHFGKVVFRWGGPLTMISLVSPAFYFLSRLVMIGEVIAALRAEDPAVYETYVASTYWIHLL
ncbi:hypothetical protein BGZ57DRAFT_983426 [Hyaloscypha finlandica]|nr:hypothetical protein BGZ57DRAFT_983426 [Hyaloscypha finlandica]